MSIVIIGGHERMETQYKQICKKYKCKAKGFTKMKGNLKEQIGKPDLMILLQQRRLIRWYIVQSQNLERNHTRIERCHSSSASALKGILEQYA